MYCLYCLYWPRCRPSNRVIISSQWHQLLGTWRSAGVFAADG